MKSGVVMKKLNKISRMVTVVAFAVCCFCFFSCTSVKVPEVPELTKYDDMLFWKIQGKDGNGKLATIYVLGTIHVGDERLYPISEEILKAYGSADKVYGEISSEGWKSLTGETMKLMTKAKQEAELIQYERDEYWFDTLTLEQQNFLYEKIGKTMVDSQKYSMPWVLSTFMTDLSINGTGLSANYSYDMHFITVSNNLGIEMYGLDDIKVQLDVLAYGDYDFQLEMLKTSIDEFLEDEQKLKDETVDMYEAYLSGDENQVSSFLFADIEKEIEEDPNMQGYYDALFVNRNENWAETFSQLIYDGGTTFVFAGSGHFVGEDSVFSIMEAKGDLVR